ncbi:MAG: hypothetical protein C0608_00895 [Deltaproteobacteria bacterium]|nr:MAG: hypothetical protein C0608_00895 [Deltaproteobacteria bacterium]
MGTITKRIDREQSLTTFVGSGELSSHEFLESINDFYRGEVTLNVLWDLTQADLKKIDSHSVREFTVVPTDAEESRRGGKTAVVVSSTYGFGLSRMYQLQKEVGEHSFETMVFRTLDEALKWITSG